ncbi:hypothetical protein BDV96DRAFT_200288 [Lophiotrema nucula]|uniref:5-formyltetrahydrofolate cyclo-ligase n=1 Tax=Lophiotrema nucula TaxID=690887 RepID=A0A6A5YTJ5_9PLEO|nr:hypothetical protein BDV96DRAFT_200288 [Lophiotrema nucula]
MAAAPAVGPKTDLRERVWLSLLRYGIPDSRFGSDFSSFHPDFRDSSRAIECTVNLPGYRVAKTMFIGPDNALQELRYRALQAGKLVLTTTYALRRGFILLDPQRISADKYEVASMLDGMEKLGRTISMAQLRDELREIKICFTGARAVSTHGRRFGNGLGHFDLAWGILSDRKLVNPATPVIGVIHDCQVVDPEALELQPVTSTHWDVPCDYVVTPAKMCQLTFTEKPTQGIIWDQLKPGQLESIPDLQELKGIQMMEKIMQDMAPTPETQNPAPSMPTADELMGIQMMERIMKGYKS